MAKRVKIPGRLESAETGNIVTGADAVMDDAKGKTQVVINSEVDAAIISLAQGKQDALTFDNTPTEGSPNPVTSAGVYTADKVLSDAIEAILLLIPSAASALNKLVDMQTMNSSIATATASFKGTYNLVSDLHLGVDATHEQIGAALDALSLGADNNDYAFVQVPNSATAPTEIRVTERYKFNGTNWLFEYDLNNSGFTQGQWNAINSGVTSLLVGKLSDLPTNAELTNLLAGKQDNLTFDNVPTAGSPNPVKSGGVYARNNEIVALINALDAAKQDVLTFDNAPVEGSPNPVKSGGVYTAISAVQAAIVALDAEKQNVLTFDSTPTLGSPNPVTSSGIKTELNRIDGNITTLNDLYEALTQSALVIVQPTDTWPVASPASKTIYRVVDRVNTPPQYYSDYMWNGTTMVQMAQYDNAIDEEPTAGSNNLVKSKGIIPVFYSVYSSILNEDTKVVNTNNAYTVDINTDLKKGTVVEFSFDSSDGAKLGAGGWAVTYPTGEVTNVVVIGVGQTEKYILTDDCSRIRCWYNVTAGGTITSKVETKGLEEETRELEDRTTILEQNVDTLDQSVYGYILNEDTKVISTNNAYTVDINTDLKRGSIIEISLSSDDGAVSDSVAWGVTYPTGEVTNVAILEIGQATKYTLTDDCSRIRCWGLITTGGTITSIIKVIGLIEKVDDLDESISNSYNYEDIQTKETDTYCEALFNVHLKKGYKVKFSLNSNDGATVRYGAWGVTYPTGEVTDIANTMIGQTAEYILTDDCSRIRLYAPVTVGGTITSKIEVIGLMERVCVLEQNIHQGKILSILGDSYSTYGLWIPTTNTWYAINGEDGHNSDANNNVNDVSQTWWYKLCNRLRVSLLLNDSYNGSPICNTGYNHSDASSYSFIHRMIDSLGVNNALKVKPHIIIIFGGTNDSWADSPLGELKYSNWTDEDLESVLPAMCYMFDYIKKWNPGAFIVNVVNTDLKTEIANAFTEATYHYNITNVVLNDIGKTGGHPNISGMISICDQIYDAIHTMY